MSQPFGTTHPASWPMGTAGLGLEVLALPVVLCALTSRGDTHGALARLRCPWQGARTRGPTSGRACARGRRSVEGLTLGDCSGNYNKPSRL
jgi:hypothetical protein